MGESLVAEGVEVMEVLAPIEDDTRLPELL